MFKFSNSKTNKKPAKAVFGWSPGKTKLLPLAGILEAVVDQPAQNSEYPKGRNNQNVSEAHNKFELLFRSFEDEKNYDSKNTRQNIEDEEPLLKLFSYEDNIWLAAAPRNNPLATSLQKSLNVANWDFDNCIISKPSYMSVSLLSINPGSMIFFEIHGNK